MNELKRERNRALAAKRRANLAVRRKDMTKSQLKAAGRAEELRVQEVRRGASERLAERAVAIEKFELAAASSVCYRAGRFNVTEYVDSVIEGSRLGSMSAVEHCVLGIGSGFSDGPAGACSNSPAMIIRRTRAKWLSSCLQETRR
jgi:hypothetical protein